jgi:hypothetical protein
MTAASNGQAGQGPCAIVLGADETSVRLTVDGEPAVLSWRQLRVAAAQDDAIRTYELTGQLTAVDKGAAQVALARAYQRILHLAEEHAREHSPLLVTWGHDHTNVRYVARARCAWGGVPMDDRLKTSVTSDLGRSSDDDGFAAHVAATYAREVTERYGREVTVHH